MEVEVAINEIDLLFVRVFFFEFDLIVLCSASIASCCFARNSEHATYTGFPLDDFHIATNRVWNE